MAPDKLAYIPPHLRRKKVDVKPVEESQKPAFIPPHLRPKNIVKKPVEKKPVEVKHVEENHELTFIPPHLRPKNIEETSGEENHKPAFIPPHLRPKKAEEKSVEEKHTPAFIPPHLRSKKAEEKTEEQYLDSTSANSTTVAQQVTSSSQSGNKSVEQKCHSPAQKNDSAKALDELPESDIKTSPSQPSSMSTKKQEQNPSQDTRNTDITEKHDSAQPSNKDPSQKPSKSHAAPIKPTGQQNGNAPGPYVKKPSGWLTKEERKAMRPRPVNYDAGNEDRGFADANWDSNAVQVLVDWEGKWLPAPVEWEGRKTFVRTNYYETIADWVAVSNMFANHKHSGRPRLVVDLQKFISEDKPHVEVQSYQCDIAPRAWIPDVVDNQSIQTYWRNSQESDLKPIDLDDDKHPPFWHLYRSNVIDLQFPLVVPDANLDPADEEIVKGMYRKGRSTTNTSTELIKDREAKASMSEDIRKRLEKAERRRVREERKEVKITPPPNPNRPKVNIFLRPACWGDVQQITDIYNWYIKNSSFVNEMAPFTVDQVRQRLNAIEATGLPSMVAVEKSNQKQPKGKRNWEPNAHSTQERILGFACAENYEGGECAFRYCVEAKVYVHHEYLRKGIGRSLLDRTMWLLHAQYKSQDAVDWCACPDELGWVTAGGRRVVASVMAFVNYDTTDRSRVTWMERFLEDFGFEKKGELEDCGFKRSECISRAIFQAKATEMNPRAVV